MRSLRLLRERASLLVEDVAKSGVLAKVMQFGCFYGNIANL